MSAATRIASTHSSTRELCSLTFQLAALVTLLLAWPATLDAGTGTVLERPAPGRRPKNGLQMKVDTYWVNANGYRPIDVEFTVWPPGPARADRNLTIIFRPNDWYSSSPVDRYTYYVEIPQGAASVKTTLPVPQMENWHWLDVEVYEDGVKLDDLSFRTQADPMSRGGSNEGIASILLIDGAAPMTWERERRMRVLAPRREATYKLPDFRPLVQLLPEGNQLGIEYASDVQVIDDVTLLQLLENLPHVELLPPQELPDQWIHYTCLDMIVVSIDELKSLKEQHPDTFQAIRSWLATGPTLCVYGVGEDFERLAELESLAALEPLDDEQRNHDPLGWFIPDDADYERELQFYRERVQRWTEPAIDMMEETEEPAGSRPPEDTPFVWRRANLGAVVAIRSDSPWGNEARHLWPWILNTLDDHRWLWYRRHGISMQSSNREYWNFLIPGVGLAPVTAFCIFISLFVVVIGPVNYFALHRWRRLSLLLITVPGGAALVTIALLGYALITDGLGVRVRARSFTEIDQRTGRAASWSRQSYYAGLAPSRGLTFPDNSAVYRIDPLGDPDYYGYGGESSGTSKHIEWDEHEQRLARGFLQSRVTSQFLVVRTRNTTAGLTIKEAPAGSQPPQVENMLTANIHQLLLIDSRGDAYWAEDVKPGESFKPQPIELNSAVTQLKSTYKANRPEFPKNLDPDAYYYSYVYGPQYVTMYSDYGEFPAATFDTSLLEINLDHVLREASGRSSGRLVPRTYVAIVDRSPEVPLGAKSPHETASFHVIFGKW